MAKKEKYICDSCGKEMDKLGITVIEHFYNHEHHLCNSGCLYDWSRGWNYLSKKKDANLAKDTKVGLNEQGVKDE